MSQQKGDGRRVQRVEREIQMTVAQYLISGFRTPLKGIVTISKVMMPGDLRSAKVYVSVLGEESDQKQTIEVLNNNSKEVQHYIAQQLKMRFCPTLKFYHDHTTEQVLKIDNILNALKNEKKEEN